MNPPGHLGVLLQPRPPSPLREVRDERFERCGVRLLLKRDDLIHTTLPWDADALGPVDLHPSGNKWRKLAPNLRAALAGGHDTVATFGGAYSNHLRATAAAGRLLGLRTVGIVRGEELAGRPLNASLARCAADGMRLHFVPRSDYRAKADPQVRDRLLAEAGAPGAYAVPEGGSNPLALAGCAELGRELRGLTDVAAVACGTGGTLAGLAAGLDPEQRALGVPVLAGGFLDAEIRSLQERAFGGPAGSWTLAEGYHHGGYARVPAALEAFAADFEARHGVPVERIYVAKLLWALADLAAAGAFPRGTALTAVVTGRP
ncbi:1-aminocyclopropane-1-carboxylate deaminase/D-cysteine desulfhydrase [Streptomyces subrutilus]|uniref:1-aminocyclopropane-1-carboxylate deaminase n=1 Tax=Streptomyces subrutilus TaxID=36818 RepID=A0A5P2UIN9_9ACTN|nr:pyridoxal-phosphate dependent enzyme [Streptomyces subrutilus]QEU78850.1 pyridoxal-phosphate dependent enzyme [Streptomyces subrutilus]WSJ31965.1 pyridoxal-phosphate dependent enzyme [Streptomyces subrutilus]GGZ83593.1 1-aminocyclopropane-1-carboxylate deaminase [Streptomyces subrutilus]